MAASKAYNPLFYFVHGHKGTPSW